MGSYTDFTIDGYPILETKSYAIPEVMTVFQDSDKCIAKRKLSDRNELVWGKPQSCDDREEVGVTYSCEVWKVVDRLNILGFTYGRVREEFEKTRLEEIEKYSLWIDESEDDWCREELDYFTNLNFEKYTEALRTVLKKRIRPHQYAQLTNELDPIVQKIVQGNEDFHFGFLFTDFRLFIRLVCELVPRNSLVIQDLTEVVEAGYYEKDEPVCANTILELTAGHSENSARIILTEGSTDIEILREALVLLYPHLVGYYSFLDFMSSRHQGSAGSLVTTIKAFAAAGISNRIIAIFDNDSAAFDARRPLTSIKLPQNISVCNYPDLNELEAYPTLGPNGHTPLNVNGLAASIELYLGKDILGNGENFPVQWKGYIDALGKYQGEVMHKKQLLKRFRDKVERCKSSKNEFDRCDWSGLRSILELIFNAFN